MPGRLSRHDSYGRPLPHLAEAPRHDLSASATNTAQRERILARVAALLDEHYPHLLRRDINAEVTLSFKIQRGTMQGDVYVVVEWHYRAEEE